MQEKRCSESVGTRGTKPAEQTSWLKKDARMSRHCSVEELAFWNENLERTGWMKRDTSSSALRRPSMEAIEEL